MKQNWSIQLTTQCRYLFTNLPAAFVYIDKMLAAPIGLYYAENIAVFKETVLLTFCFNCDDFHEAGKQREKEKHKIKQGIIATKCYL